MIKLIAFKPAFALLISFAFQTAAMAGNDHDRDHHKSRCDVVSLNGSGQLLENGSIAGTEVLTILETGKQIEVEFIATPLGVLEADPNSGVTEIVASHDFTGVNKRRINFTTFDDLTIIPFAQDPTCLQNACGLKFKLKLETGNGRYNCGEIVSGINSDPSAPIPFTSFVDPGNPAPDGDTVIDRGESGEWDAAFAKTGFGVRVEPAVPPSAPGRREARPRRQSHADLDARRAITERTPGTGDVELLRPLNAPEPTA